METTTTKQTFDIVFPKEAVKEAVREVLQEQGYPTQPTEASGIRYREALDFDHARLALKVSAPTLRKLLTSKRLHGVRSGRKWIIPAEAIDAFLTGGQP